MKKTLCLAATFLVTLSITGCAVGNNRVGDRNGIGNNINNSTGTRRISLQNYNNTNVSYKDGIYVGYGNARGNKNARAVVKIRNGRIVDIDLSDTNQGTNNTTGKAANNQQITNNGAGTNALLPGTGTTTGKGKNNPVGNNNNAAIGNGKVPGTATGLGNQSGNNIDNGIGGAVGTAIDDVKTALVNLMIRDQRYDVNYTNNNTNLTGTIENYKLAVSRALSQARR